jgi:hypothetical protein
MKVKDLLQELIGIKKYQGVDLLQLLMKLQSEKKINVKNGSFSVVIIPENEDFVYRVWTQDGGWLDYMEYCIDHQDNPHILKIKSRAKKIPFIFQRPEGFETTLYVVKTEKLQPLISNIDLFDQVRVFSNIVQRDFPTYAIVNKRIKEQTGIKTDFDKSLYDTVKDLQEHSPFLLDISTSNVMLRGTTLVLSDPIAEVGTKEFKTAADIIISKKFK